MSEQTMMGEVVDPMTPEQQAAATNHDPKSLGPGKRVVLPNGNSVSAWPYLTSDGAEGLHVNYTSRNGHVVTESWLNLSMEAVRASYSLFGAMIVESLGATSSLALASDDEPKGGEAR